MRLAYICGTTGWGGLEMNQLKNALWMQDRGHAVWVFCLPETPTDKAANEMNLPVVHLSPFRKYYDWLAAWRLSRKLLKLNIEFLMTRAYTDMSLVAGATFFGRKKFKSVFFMEMALGAPKKQLLRTFRYRQFAAWSCPLESLKNQVEDWTNYPKDRLKVIPSGMDLSLVVNEEKHKSRTRLGLPKEGFIFGLIGRLDRQKGQKEALIAFQHLADESTHLVFVGESTPNDASNYEIELKDFIEKNNLTSCVHFLPFQKRPFEVFNAFDVTLMASYSETFGMVTIESMAQGVPVIGSDKGGTPELLKNGEIGYLFSSQNAFDLAEKMRQAKVEFPRFTKEQLQRSVEKFDFHTVCIQVEQLLTSLSNQ
ncbi:MAG: hypothetical protein RL264_1610 [Bacteroidota bacterium]|jgi:glycosyltransferase involved in cell wall biosynthesis